MASPTTQDITQSNVQQDIKTSLERADQAHDAGDIPLAHSIFVQATEIDPKSLEAWIGRATNGQDLDDIIRSWAHASALFPEKAELGAALNERVREKVESETSTAPSLLALAKTLGEVGRKDDAYTLARRATELEERNDVAWVWRGGLANDLQEMVSCLRQALVLNPNNLQAKAGLEWAQSFKGAEEKPTLSSVEPSQEALNGGLLVLRQGDKARARELFQRATELDAENEQAWLWRASATSDVEEALSCIEQALALNPANESAREAREWLRVKKLRASTQRSAPKPTAPLPDLKNAPRRQTSRAARIIPLSLLILAILILVIALLFARAM